MGFAANFGRKPLFTQLVCLLQRYFHYLRVREHIAKDLVEIVAYMLDLHLLIDQIILNLVDPDVETLNIHCCIFFPVFGIL